MTIALRFFYRRVYATGLETIARNGPVIIIANHTSSLMDAALLGVLINRPIHFFTRADVFSSKFYSRILDALHMLPVNNHEAGRNSLSANNESFSRAQQILKQGGIVVFFPEGISHVERKLLPLRKGVFRLAFQSAVCDNFSRNIPVVPVGINYSHPSACQADVMIHFGTPLLLNDYKEEYLSNAAASLLHITKDSYSAIRKNALHIQDESRYALVDDCLKIRRNDYSLFTKQWLQGTQKRLDEEKFICSNIEQLMTREQSALQQNNNEYFKMLKKYKIRDRVISPLFNFSIMKKLLLVAGTPLFVIGYFLNCLPLLISRKIADTKVYRTDFYSWIYVVCAAFSYLLWLVILFLGFITPGWQYAVTIVMATIIGGIFVHYYLGYWIDFMHLQRLRRLEQKYPAVLRELKNRRQKIIDVMNSSRQDHQEDLQTFD